MNAIFSGIAIAISQGHWLIIPAIFLLINFSVSSWIVIPHFLNRYIELPHPSQTLQDSPDDSIQRWLSGFQYEITLLCRLGIIFGLTLSIFCGGLFLSSPILNGIAKVRVLPPLPISIESDNLLIPIILGLILIAAGFYFILYFRNRAKGRDALQEFMFKFNLFTLILSIGINLVMFVLVSFRVVSISDPDVVISLCGPVYYSLIQLFVIFFHVQSDSYSKSKLSGDRSFRFSKLADPSDRGVLLDQGYEKVNIQDKPLDAPFRFSEVEDSSQKKDSREES